MAAGKPLIVWHIERLAAAGITELVINHAHLGHMLESALGDGHALGVSIHWSPEGTSARETAGGIRLALPFLGETPFLAVNGDVFCDADFSALADKAQGLSADKGDLAHLLLVDNPAHHPDGDFALAAGRVMSAGEPRLTFAGIGAYHPALFADIAAGEHARLAPLLRTAMTQRQVSGEHHRGEWEDIGTPERLAALDARLTLSAPRQAGGIE
jgi:MurNAc alpha-1-phosphate uridylyltransferase